MGIVLAVAAGIIVLIAQLLVLKYKIDTMDLSQAIEKFASKTTESNKMVVYNVLAKSKVGLIVLQSNVELKPLEPYKTKKTDIIEVAITTIPNGDKYLLVVSDVPTYYSKHPKKRIAEVDSKTALEMSISDGFQGLVVENPNQTWVAIPKNDVLFILDIPCVKLRKDDHLASHRS